MHPSQAHHFDIQIHSHTRLSTESFATIPNKSYSRTSYTKGSAATIKEIYFSLQDLTLATSHSEPVCFSEIFVDVLVRIEAEEDQESVVEQGVEGSCQGTPVLENEMLLY